MLRLQSALQEAIQQTKSHTETPELGLSTGSAPGLHPHISLFHLLTAVKLVFSSAAAISAVFGLPSQVTELLSFALHKLACLLELKLADAVSFADSHST